MKNLIIILLVFVSITAKSQLLIGKNWVDVQFLLASMKTSNPTYSLQLSDRDVLHHVYHTIELHDITQYRDWIIIETHFDDKGICNYVAYTDLESKEYALTYAQKMLSTYKLVYTNSTEDGLMDHYLLLDKTKSLSNLKVDVGSTKELPTDIMVIVWRTAGFDAKYLK